MPLRRRASYAPLLKSICTRVMELLPRMSAHQVAKVLIAFDQLRKKRKPDELLFIEPTTFAECFKRLQGAQLPVQLVYPLLKAYRAMGIFDVHFCKSVVQELMREQVPSVTEYGFLNFYKFQFQAVRLQNLLLAPWQSLPTTVKGRCGVLIIDQNGTKTLTFLRHHARRRNLFQNSSPVFGLPGFLLH